MKNKVKNTFVSKVIFTLPNLFISIFNYFKRPKKCENIEVCRIERFEEEADFFWKEISNCYSVIVPRNRAYANWKYVD